MAKGKTNGGGNPPNEKIVSGEVISISGIPHRVRGGVLIPEGEPNAELFDGGALDDDAVMEPALQSVMAELGANDDQAKVTVSRVQNVNGIKKELYLFESHPSQFTLQDLQEAYGEGDYRIKVYGKQPGTNYKVIHANKLVSIGPTREQAKGIAKPAALGSNVTVQNSGGSEVAKAIADTLAPILAAQGALLAKLANGDGGAGRKALLEEMEIMARITGAGKQADPFSGMENLLKVVTLVKGLTSNDGAGLDAESGPYAVIMEGLRTFGSLVHQGKNTAAPAPAATQRLASPHPSAQPVPDNAAAAAPQPDPEDQEEIMFLRAQLAILLSAAKANGNPETYAGLIYEQAPDEILAMVEADDYFVKLCEIVPEFAPHKEWCESVRALVLADLKDDPEWSARKTAALTGASVTGTTTGNVPGPTTKPVADGSVRGA